MSFDLDTIVKEDIDRHEDTVLHAYPDSKGYLTIGTGRLIDKRKGGGLTKEEADYLRDNDIGRCRSELMRNLPWFNRTPPQIRRALINMCFQMGITKLLGFKKTLHLIQDGRYPEAADEALRSDWARYDSPARAKEVAGWIRSAGQ